MSGIFVALGIALMVSWLVVFVAFAAPAYLDLDHQMSIHAKDNPGMKPTFFGALWLSNLSDRDRRRIDSLKLSVIRRTVTAFGLMFAGWLFLVLGMMW